MKFKAPTSSAVLLTAGMALFAGFGFISHAQSQAADGDKATTKLVADMLTRYHISQKKIDDDISTRMLKRFIEQVDPQKLYFTKADVTEFEKSKTELDDQLSAGDVAFAYKVYERYAERLKERMKLVHDKLIDADYDFTAKEEMVTDADELDWPKSDAEISDRWRKRVKYELLSLKLDDTDLKDARERLHKRYRIIDVTLQQTEDHEKLESYLSAMTHCFDPHSSYMSPQTVEDFQIQMRLRLQGIGAALRSDDGYTVVANVVDGGAAQKDGRLKKGDKIIAVAQDDDGQWVDIVEMKLSRVVRLIRGKAGTVVRLKVKTKPAIEKPGEELPEVTKEYALTRQTVELKSSEVKGEIIDAGSRVKGAKGKIGVINIPSFYRDFDGARNHVENFKSTSRDVRRELKKFEDAGGVDAVVIDLRFNGGGALSEAIEVSGLFINQGPVVMVKELSGNRKMHNDDDEGVAWDGPLVVVCNRLSASASEIFAGAIKDYGRGIIVGDTTTHGKGTVQNVMPVSRQLFRFLNPSENRGALKLTINQFYRVNGDSTQNRGVKSDVVLPSMLDHMDLGEEFLDNALKFDRIDPVRHEQYGMRTAEVLKSIQDNSAKRVSGDEEFGKIKNRIDEYLKRKNRKSITLNEAQLRAERKAEKKDEEVKDKETEAESKEDGPIFPEGAYNDELLSISLDYANLVNAQKTAKR